MLDTDRQTSRPPDGKQSPLPTISTTESYRYAVSHCVLFREKPTLSWHTWQSREKNIQTEAASRSKRLRLLAQSGPCY